MYFVEYVVYNSSILNIIQIMKLYSLERDLTYVRNRTNLVLYDVTL